MSDSNNNLKGLLVTQSVLLVIALIGIYGNWINTKETNQNELEKELILNAYSLSDSSQQINRLKTFCDLNFFKEDRKQIILKKIEEGKIYTQPKLIIFSDILVDDLKALGFVVDSISNTQDSIIKRLQKKKVQNIMKEIEKAHKNQNITVIMSK